MAKLTSVLFMATLLLLVTVAATAASAYHISMEIDVTGCSQEIRERRLSSCRQYLRDSSRLDNEGGWREAFPRCCDELEQMNEQCRCEAIKKVAQQQSRAGELEGREMRELVQTAKSLPSLCRIPPQYCENIQEMF